jgi:CspA family cold shock protein
LDDETPAGASLEAPVKFFNRAKGFGFVTLPDGQDVFFHVSSLTPLGLTAVDQGDVLVCEVGQVPRGRQVTRIVEVKHGAAPVPEGTRPPRREFGDRPPRREFGDRPPRREFGSGGGFGDRPPRRDFGDRPPRREFGAGFGGMGDRPPRREFGARSFAPDGPSEIVAGTVKFFDVRKGFGFIVPENGTDVFVPLRALGAITPESLTPGRRVKATVVTGPKGRQALSVEVL